MDPAYIRYGRSTGANKPPRCDFNVWRIKLTDYEFISTATLQIDVYLQPVTMWNYSILTSMALSTTLTLY
ncbi:MAG: hypothetical protein QGD96_12900, partial [Anaerolineae bacterium]|nr:hypothetical protein [Anaerolineae bacterium]